MTRATHTPWLTLLGIGEDGLDGLSLAARTALAQARLVVGGRRHLALAGPLACETMAWPSPIGDAIPAILARRGEPVCVLASGDPFLHGIGTLLAASLHPDDFTCLPAPSSLGLAAARLGWTQQDCVIVSLHGRDLRRIVPHLQPRARLLCLTWDETTPGRIAVLLRERGLGGSTLHVLQALGGPRETIVSASADRFAIDDIDALNVVAIEIEADAASRLIPIAPGLPDDWFENDGQITKREIRAMTLAALRPFRGAHLWDIGAGSGSIAIEWALLDPANRATAIEAHPDRAARIARNAGALGVPDIAIVTGRAPEVLAGLPPPDAIFIGGGAGDGALVEAAWAALPRGGRLVINAVTIETQGRLIALYAGRGGDLTSIAVSRADPVGRMHGWRPAMPVTQWTGDQTVIAVGIGCRKACPAGDIVALVRRAMDTIPEAITEATPAGLFSVAEKRGEPGLIEAAAMLGLPLVFLDTAVLRLVAGDAKSCSRRVEDMFGLPGIAETAALAGAGQGAVLLVPRLTAPTATCAIAGPTTHASPVTINPSP